METSKKRQVHNLRDETERATLDRYPSPRISLELLKGTGELDDLKNEKIVEPASGMGHISKFLEANGFNVESSDLGDDSETYGTGGLDFLARTERCENIITNPPYRQAIEFLKHAISITDHKVIMLLRLNFLESQSRFEFFKQFPPAKVYVISKRLPHYDPVHKEWKSDASFSHMWMVFDNKTSTIETKIDWIM